MMVPNVDIDKKLDDVIEIGKRSFYSRNDAEKDRTERLRLDMQSDEKLSKKVRPLVTLILVTNQVLLSWLVIALLYLKIDATGARDVLFANAGLLASALSWYFYSKKVERVTEKKAIAAIAIEKENKKMERIRERREYNMEKIRTRREEKRKIREERKNN